MNPGTPQGQFQPSVYLGREPGLDRPVFRVLYGTMGLIPSNPRWTSALPRRVGCGGHVQGDGEGAGSARVDGGPVPSRRAFFQGETCPVSVVRGSFFWAGGTRLSDCAAFFLFGASGGTETF